MEFITEPQREVPIADEVDLCVVGGSCTGVFAAVRAARLGLRVGLIEQHYMLGGMATTAYITHWHSTLDSKDDGKVIGGLLDEVIHRLRRRNAILELPPPTRTQYKFNPAALAYELDHLIRENGIRTFLGARFSVPILKGNRVDAVVIEDKSGRRAIKASYYIDASGDGDLLTRAGFETVKQTPLQPASYQIMASGIDDVFENYSDLDIWQEVRSLAEKYQFPDSNPWIDVVPGVTGINNIFGPRMQGVDASDPDQLTQATLEGRRTAVAYLDMIRDRFPEHSHRIAVASFAQHLGIRETRKALCHYHLTGDDLLSGKVFEDAIANGTYPVDIHHPEGTLLRYLDGRECVITPAGEITWRTWRSPDTETPRCYHIPYRSLVPKKAVNLLCAGRLIDADRNAYGATRVMVNCNQTGEAAGVAAAIALDEGIEVGEVDATKLRYVLSAGGSIII